MLSLCIEMECWRITGVKKIFDEAQNEINTWSDNIFLSFISIGRSFEVSISSF